MTGGSLFRQWKKRSQQKKNGEDNWGILGVRCFVRARKGDKNEYPVLGKRGEGLEKKSI